MAIDWRGGGPTDVGGGRVGRKRPRRWAAWHLRGTRKQIGQSPHLHQTKGVEPAIFRPVRFARAENSNNRRNPFAVKWFGRFLRPVARREKPPKTRFWARFSLQTACQFGRFSSPTRPNRLAARHDCVAAVRTERLCQAAVTHNHLADVPRCQCRQRAALDWCASRNSARIAQLSGLMSIRSGARRFPANTFWTAPL